MSEHTDVAAYSLGLLESNDRLEFEAHLADCPSCAAELAEFSALADLLAGVEPVESGQVEPDDAAVVDLISRRAAQRRHQVRQRLAVAAAACLVVLAGGVGVGIAVSPGQSPSATALAGQLHSATDKATGASGTVGLVAKPWGTEITLDLSGVRGPLECQMIAVSATGQRAIAAGWLVPATGYGVPGHPAHLIIAGGTAIMSQNLSRVVVDVAGGGTLVSIPI